MMEVKGRRVMIVGLGVSGRAAARFLGAARRMHRVSGASGISVTAPPIADDVVAQLRAALGENAYAEFVGEGERAFAADVVDAVRVFSLAVGSTL